jgi:NAD-dependent deacetylase
MRDLAEKKETLKRWIEAAKHAVFFGGAGVSTASGVPDYRSAGGIYETHANAEEMLSIGFMERYPDEFWPFYRKYFMAKNNGPNRVHRFLADWEKRGGLSGIVTQNVDGLHQEAGSKNVAELHGTSKHFYCAGCGKDASFDDVLQMDEVPYCSCGGIFRPDIVLYGEGLDNDVVRTAVEWITVSDLLIVAGTSLAVYPAAGLIQYRPRSCRLAILNRTATPFDAGADLALSGDLVDLFPERL